MKPIVLTPCRAALGWPLYAAWNMAAYAKEQEGPSAKAKVALCGILLVTSTTALWMAAWLWVIWQAVRFLSPTA